MTPPPGPHGGPYGRPGPPGPYGPPGAPGPYGPPPGGYVPGGPFGQPPKKNLLPWIIVAVAVVLVGAGVVAVLLLRGDDGGTAPAAATTSSSAPASSGDASLDADAGMGSGALPGGASVATGHPGGGSVDTDAPSTGSDGAYTGSDEVAVEWLSALLDADADGAFALSCPDLQASATQGSQGSGLSPAQYLTSYFYDRTLGGHTFTDGQLTAVDHDAGSGYDLASADLTLDDGTTQTVTVAVDASLTVCDWS